MSFKIALQLYSVREDAAKDFAGVLRQVKAMGYDGVEFAGLHGFAPAEVRAMCAAAELIPVSAHVPLDDLRRDPDGVAADYAAIGCRYVAIPYLTPEYRPGQPRFAEVIETARTAGQAMKNAGIQLLYHNHDFEFETIDGEYALDTLYRVVPADLLATQLDLCWVNVGGEEPAAYLRRYIGRAPVVHFKDFVMPGKKPANMYQLIGQAAVEQADAAAFEYRPLGQGVQDIPALVAAANDAGAEWVVIEQDEPCLGLSPLTCAKQSLDFLRSKL